MNFEQASKITHLYKTFPLDTQEQRELIAIVHPSYNNPKYLAARDEVILNFSRSLFEEAKMKEYSGMEQLIIEFPD